MLRYAKWAMKLTCEIVGNPPTCEMGTLIFLRLDNKSRILLCSLFIENNERSYSHCDNVYAGNEH